MRWFRYAVAMFDTALPYLKAALINYTHQLSIDYMKDGIRANCVCPGPTYIDGGFTRNVKY